MAVDTDGGSKIIALNPAGRSADARSPVLDMSVSAIGVSPDGRFIYLASDVDSQVDVLAADDLSVIQRVHLPLDSGSIVAVSPAGLTRGTVYAAQSGDFTDPTAHPAVVPLLQGDPGEPVARASSGGSAPNAVGEPPGADHDGQPPGRPSTSDGSVLVMTIVLCAAAAVAAALAGGIWMSRRARARRPSPRRPQR